MRVDLDQSGGGPAVVGLGVVAHNVVKRLAREAGLEPPQHRLAGGRANEAYNCCNMTYRQEDTHGDKIATCARVHPSPQKNEHVS